MANNKEIPAEVALAAAALKSAGAREVYLFGSVLSKFRAGSDVDLAVSGLAPERFYRAMADAGRFLRRPLDLIDLDRDSSFTRYLKHEGKLRRVE